MHSICHPAAPQGRNPVIRLLSLLGCLLVLGGCGQRPSGDALLEEMTRGRELARIRQAGHRYSVNPSQPAAAAMGETRKQLIEQGIQVFRQVLDKDPRHAEAMLCLGLCLVDKDVAAVEEGLAWLDKVNQPGVESNQVWAARWILARYYDDPGRDMAKAAALYRQNWETLPTATEREAYHEVLGGHYEKAFVLGTLEGAAFVDWLVERDRVALQAALERATPEIPARPGRIFEPSLAVIPLLLNKDPALVERYVGRSVDALESERPNLAPHFTAWLATLEATNLPPVIEFRHLQSIGWCLEHSGEVHDPAVFFTESLKAAMASHAKHARKTAGLRTAELMVAQAPPHLTEGDLAWVHFHVGWIHRFHGELEKAAEAFDRMGDRETRVLEGGYWGRFGVYSGKVMAQECRLLLAGKSPADRLPPREILGEPEMVFFSPSLFLFASDGPRLWLLLEGNLMTYDKGTRQTNVLASAAWGGAPGFPIMAVGESHLWLGTQGDGLVAVDKATGAARTFRTAEGLYADYINRIHVQGDRIWLGFGDVRPLGPTNPRPAQGRHGIGYIALPAMTFEGVLASSAQNLEVAQAGETFSGQVQPEAQAPSSVIRDLAQVDEQELLAVSSGRLHRLNLSDRSWSRLHETSYMTSVAANERFIVTGALEPTSNKPPESGRWGGVSILDRSQEGWKHVGRSEGLPHNDVTALALDGERVWVGSRGFVARIGLATGTIERLYVSRDTGHPFRQVEVDGNELWFAATEDVRGGQTRLYRMSLD